MPNKSKSELKLNFTKMVALANQELEAFSNLFSYHDDTYFHKNIGSLFGVIQILDQSEQSEYIPNLLTSIIKKEFYSQPHRATEESFEASLKKANLALADLAEHDIVNWNGQLHALIGVFKKNKLYFTQVGNASIFLGRDKKLLNLSENNLRPPAHPIKTFQDIVVGEIKDKDKIIVTGPTIYNIFKFTDLTRLFDTFNSEEFDNLVLKTLEKEANNAVLLITNIKEKVSEITFIDEFNENNITGEDTLDKLTKNKNFLGGKIKKEKKTQLNETKSEIKKTKPTKIKSKKNKLDSTADNEKKPRVTNVPLEESASAKFPKKHSHSTSTSIKEPEKTTKIKSAPTIKSEKITKKNISQPQKNSAIKNALIEKTNDKKIKKLNDLKPKELKKTEKGLSPFEQTPEIYISSDDDDVKKAKKKVSGKKLKQFFVIPKEKTFSSEKINSKKIATPTPEVSTSTLPETKTPSLKSTENISPSPIEPIVKNNKNLSTKLQSLATALKNKSLKLFKILKDYGQILLLKLNLKKKEVIGKNIYVNSKNKLKGVNFKDFTFAKLINFIKVNYIIVGFIAFLILVPLIIFQIASHHQKTKNHSQKPISEIAPQAITSPTIKNLNPSQVVITLPNNIKFISGNDNLILAYDSSGKVYEISQDKKQITPAKVPTDIKLDDIKSLTYMSSLNLFFLSSNSQVLSYSPATHKFYKNKINLPDNFSLMDQGTYLDYLYLLDQNSEQIYRYPRDTGGFGKQKAWLKTPLKNSQGLIAIAVDDTIKLAYSNGKIETYFKNKLAQTNQFKVKKLVAIYTTINLDDYYILDQEAGKILRINKENNQIKKEYQNNILTKATNLFINKKDRKIYFSSDKNLYSMDL